MDAQTKIQSIREKLLARLDELGTAWMVEGPASLSEQKLVKIASMAQQDPELAAVAKRANVLAGQRAKNVLADEPFTELRCMITGEPMPQEAPAAHAASDEDVTPAIVENAAFDEDPEMFEGFVTEAQEHLTAIEEQILSLERDPSQLGVVHAVFRGFHTIKGLAGFLGLIYVQAVSHEVETLLDHARNERIKIDGAIVDLVLESAEYLQGEVHRVNSILASGKTVPPADNRNLIRSISESTQRALQGETAPAALTTPAEPMTPTQATPAVSRAAMAPVSAAEANAESARPAPVDVIGFSTATSEPVPTVLKTAPKAEPQSVPMGTAVVNRPFEVSGGSIRIETSKLDHLMDMVGEMVIAQSILSHNPHIATNQDARLSGDLAELARITGEVQRRAMSMRMMPIGPLFQKNAKLVRDLARKHGKQVDLRIAGESTELDKTIAEELSDPLLHMIRNALDHGIETPEERIAAGKSPTATLRLSAEHQSGKIVIAISDDGRGLDAGKILKKALQKNLVAEGAQLSQAEIYQLIFAPGFSTAEKITDISGRGVGMDVVRKHVETLRGQIQIVSELGSGTTFFIHLPLTLAIIEGLVIVVGEHRYIIPIFSVREMFRPTRDMLVSVQGSEEMILMRGDLYPLVRLHRRFGIEPRTEDICEGLVVVCEGPHRPFCLYVDDLLGRQEIVIKSLGKDFGDTSGLTGCAILGDGRIGLILDVTGIFRLPSQDAREAA